MAVRGIRSGRGTHVEPLIRWMVFVVDVHRRFAAQVHGHLELHHGDDLTPGALCRVAKCPFNNAEIPHALSVTLPAGFGRFTAMNSISPTQIESGVSPVEGPSPDAAHCRPGVGLWRTRPPNSTVWRIFHSGKLQPTARSDIFEMAELRPASRASRTTGEDRNEW